MIKRCYGSNHPTFKNYGAKGVAVCSQWQKDFYCFVTDMGPMPFSKATVERINPEGNYCPHNTKWQSYKLQRLNMRKGPEGVTKHKCGKWMAQITIEGFTYYLGLSLDKEYLTKKFNSVHKEWYGVTTIKDLI